MDEENIILALFAKTKGVDKIVAKVNEDGRAQLVEELGMHARILSRMSMLNLCISWLAEE